MRLQADDARACARRMLRKLLQLARRDSELGVRAGRAHVTVMPEPMSRIDAHEDLAVAKHLGPGSDGIRVVDGHPHALLERPGELVPRGKVRS